MRNTGQSTNQILNAPSGALYIVPHKGSLAYFNGLATYLNRTDLTIVTPGILDGLLPRIRGRKFSDIIIDHATELSLRQLDVVHEERQRMKMLVSVL